MFQLLKLEEIEEKKLVNASRFSGYQLPMEQLDETGPSYIKIERPHPYYSNQPMYWRKAVFYPYNGNVAMTPEVMAQPLYPIIQIDENLVL